MFQKENIEYELKIVKAVKSYVDFYNEHVFDDNIVLDRKDISDYNFKLLFLQMYAKVIRSSMAVIELSDKGYVEDSNIIARSILETALNMEYIKKDSKINSRLFIEYSHILKEKNFNNVINFEKDNEQFVDNLRVSLEADKQKINKAKNFRNGYKRFLKSKSIPVSDTWGMVSLKYIAENIGSEVLLNHYYKAFVLLSNDTHTNVLALKDYVDYIDNKIVIKSDPDVNRDVSMSLIVVLECLNAFSVSLNEIFKLSLEQKLEEFEKDLHDIRDFYNEFLRV